MNLPAPTAFVGVASPAEQQYLSLFQSIGDNLRNRPYNWPQLKRGYTFTTVLDQSKYELPGDFYRLLESSQWDTTNQWPLIPSTSDGMMSGSQFNAIDLQTRKLYRILGATGYVYNTTTWTHISQGTFEIDPAGENGTDSLFLGYLSCNWIWPRAWVTSTAYSSGNIRSGNGYIYIATSSGTSGATRPTHSSGSASDGAVTWKLYDGLYLCTPSNTLMNDGDVCLFDEDLMIEGMRWAYKQAKGQDFQQLRIDWESMVSSAYARFLGPVRGNMMQDDDEVWFRIPVGSWPA